ncbi:murein DD-endopeptidase MepM/ murein hydrolase activator NlpD [Breznakia blatticola]|uniref:Murein DD-endopeptidase MepM/ murein hydrolase activator NlpD n=1 Tax=Breznakia blatticola TaxID=1754012 RepID=A0A4R7Z8P3_9FIRM|nr:peptidoglycan DD-metalloendopeptidase family protein [Breznakia blatticola]TDW13100.1 murein DD-endopeptidase MepM/ murein hydrolase activator NlpD [Breznakia blatticola]
MAWQAKVAEAAGKILLGKSIEKDGAMGPIIMIATAALIPVIFIVALFSGGNGTGQDIYEKAFNNIECSQDYYYYLEDIRFFDSYTYPDGVEATDEKKIEERMQQDYFQITTPPGNTSANTFPGQNNQARPLNVCILQSDETIVNTLIIKYGVDENLKQEILESVQQMRNGRNNFILPVANSPKVLGKYGQDKKLKGIELEAPEGTEVVAVHDGVIEDIVTSKDTYYGVNEKGDVVEKTKGLTIVIKHDTILGLNKFGEYDTRIVYSHIPNLQNVKWNVGDKISQGEVIGTNAKKTVYFELRKNEDTAFDPATIMFIESSLASKGDLGLPLENPFTITSEYGKREYAGMSFHHGIDLSKSEGSSIYSVSEGEVIEANNTCDPLKGETLCPSGGYVPWGGNYVLIKSTIDNQDYYIAYCHMSRSLLKIGDKVHKGQIVGYQGNSGNSYGSHLHLEVRKEPGKQENSTVNPREIINFGEQ